MCNRENSSPYLIDCLFLENWANRGGGMDSSDSSVTLINCIFDGNWSTWSWAGGMYNYNGTAELLNCEFVGNSGRYAGAVYFSSDCIGTLTDCVFSGNSATDYHGGALRIISSALVLVNCAFANNTADSSGGGIYQYDSDVKLVNCSFSGNSATEHSGGALRISNSTSVLDKCTFTSNTADTYGGGFYQSYGITTLTNCVFSGNRSTGSKGGGGYISSGALVSSNCTYANNVAETYGGGLSLYYDTSTITNCVFLGNSDGSGSVESGQIYGDTVDVAHSCIQDLNEFAGNGNIGDDPRFLDADGPDGIPGTEDDDLHLLPDSPCINTGDNDAPSLPDEDYEGDPRIQHCRVDIGADESPYFFDCNANDEPDACDIDGDISLDCNDNVIPDECEFPEGCPGIRRADMNCDDLRNGDGIQAFVNYFTAGRYTCQADVNRDGVWDITDVSDFVSALLGGPDSDDDGVPDNEDNCPDDYSPDQEDADGDGVGDICDNCPLDENPEQEDTDDPWQNSSYSYEWIIYAPADRPDAAFTEIEGGGTGQVKYAAPERPGYSPSCLPYFVLCIVTGDNVAIHGVATYNIDVRLLADVDDSGCSNLGCTDATDVQIIQDVISGIETDPVLVDAADVNCDGTVSTIDLQIADAIAMDPPNGYDGHGNCIAP